MVEWEIIIINLVIVRYKGFLIKMASEYIHKCIALSHTATHCTVVKKEKLNKLISKKDKMIIYVSYIFSLLSI